MPFFSAIVNSRKIYRRLYGVSLCCGLKEGSDTMSVCHSVGPVRNPLRERLEEIYFWPFQIGDCVSRGSHGHVNGGAFSPANVEWDVKESLRMTNSGAVTTLSAPISDQILHNYTCRALWCGGYGPPLWIERSWVRVSVAGMWRCVLGQGTAPVRALCQPRSERAPGISWTVCLWVE